MFIAPNSFAFWSYLNIDETMLKSCFQYVVERQKEERIFKQSQHMFDLGKMLCPRLGVLCEVEKTNATRLDSYNEYTNAFLNILFGGAMLITHSLQNPKSAT